MGSTPIRKLWLTLCYQSLASCFKNSDVHAPDSATTADGVPNDKEVVERELGPGFEGGRNPNCLLKA